MLQKIRYLLLPFSLLYALITWWRNRLYDWGILRSNRFNISIIAVGNLKVGGTGKSPTIEFLIKALEPDHHIAVISRGYGRHTKGFLEVFPDSLANEVGDEPLQIKNKFPDVDFFVCEDRSFAIRKIQHQYDLILLDDAFQHRKVKPTQTILLFDFESFAHPMLVFPAGNFRDTLFETKRADLILITKCPTDLTENQKNTITKTLRKYNSHAPVYFSALQYENLRNEKGLPAEWTDQPIILLTGIANPEPLVSFIQQQNKTILKHFNYPDHHNFAATDMQQILSCYDQNKAQNPVILTTEKDFQRLKPFFITLTSVPLFYIPIQFQFLPPADKDLFCNNLCVKHL